MLRNAAENRRLARLTEAFGRDGFNVSKTVEYNGRIGAVAKSRFIFNYDTGKPKKAYYLEGAPYETGYLMGALAEEEIARMMDYTDSVVFSFIGSKALGKIKLIREALTRLVYELSKTSWKELPVQISEEIKGIYDGCKKSNPKTKVDMEHLITLNTGIDIICSTVYSGNFLKRDIYGVTPEDFNVPMMCNAFTICGKSAGYGFYFGRDFSFPSSGVFQDTAAPVIYNPAVSEPFPLCPPLCSTGSLPDKRTDDESGMRLAANSGLEAVAPAEYPAIPFVNITAPGIVGSIAAMNMEGVALGVNMSPGANSDPGNIGVNSLLMTRICAQYGGSAKEAAEIMTALPKGVSWLYIIADGKNARSCVAEAGASGPEPDFTKYPSEEYRPFLPDMQLIKRLGGEQYKNGVMFRWNDYNYPLDYLTFNYRLWKHYNDKHRTNKIIYTGAFEESGYINKGGDQNCPSSFYFSPQREDNDDILVATNHYIIPEMRYFAMHRWTERIIGKRVNDIQWRYDELNRLIYDRLAEKGSAGFEDAKELISFLAPYGKNGGYYKDNPKSGDGRETRIEGCVSAFDLKNKIVECHYGYYCDGWVRITLPEYFEGRK